MEVETVIPKNKKEIFIGMRVSGDGGETYGPRHIIGGNTAQQVLYTDVTSDSTWTPAKINNDNLTVKLECSKIFQWWNLWGLLPVTCRADWIAVNVTYNVADFDFAIIDNPTQGVIRRISQNKTFTNVSAVLLSGSNRLVDLGYEGCPMDVL